MLVEPFDDDDEIFLSYVERVISDVVSAYHPAHFLITRIDNWFGEHWVGFVGKMFGMAGIRHAARNTVVPPFVHRRITSQSYFELADDGRYANCGRGPEVHHIGPSEHNFRNYAAERIPEAALFWYSGRSKGNGQGAIMGYVPVEGTYWRWYLGVAKMTTWQLRKNINFNLPVASIQTVARTPLRSV